MNVGVSVPAVGQGGIGVSQAVSHWSAQQQATVLLFVIPAVWCSNYLIARAASGIIAPHALALGRWGLAGLIMLALTYPQIRAHWPQARREWKDWILLGTFGMWICGAIVYLGGHTTTALNMGLIYSASPVLITVASALWLHERLGPVQLGGIALSLCGVLFIISKGQPLALLNVKFTAGDGWIVLATISWSAYSLLLKQRPTVLPPAARLTCITWGGVLVLVPFAVLESVLAPAHYGAHAFSTQLWSAKPMLLIVLAAVLPGYLSYRAYSFMQIQLGAARSSLVLYLAPVYTAMLAWVLLGEKPQSFHLTGGALALVGLFLATRSPKVAGVTPTN